MPSLSPFDRSSRLWLVLFMAWLATWYSGVVCADGLRDIVECANQTDADFDRAQIDLWVQRLESAEIETRFKSIEALSRLGPEARPTIARLLQLLADDSFYRREYGLPIVIRDAVCDALIYVGAESVTPLTRDFALQPAEIKHRIQFVARRIGPPAREFLPLLVERFKAPGNKTRFATLEAIAAIDLRGETAIPLLVEAVQNDPDADVRRAAAGWLIRSDRREQVYWREEAHGKVWFAHESPRRKDVVDALLRAVQDKSPEVRGIAIHSVATFPEAAERAVPLLIKALNDRESYSRMVSNHTGDMFPIALDAAAALGRFPKQVEESWPALIVLALGPLDYRPDAIADLAPLVKNPIPMLTQLLKVDQSAVACAAAARLGSRAKPLIPQLELLTHHDNEFTAGAAQAALACLDAPGHPDAVKFVHEALKQNPNDSGRLGVLIILGQVGPAAAGFVPLLVEHLPETDDAENLDRDVLRAIESMGPAAAAAAPEIIAHLETDWSFYDDENEQTLVRLGPAVALPLMQALQEPERSPRLRICSLHVLSRLQPAVPRAVPVIIAQLDSPHPRVREAAVIALSNITAHPEESLPALKRMLSDPRPFVRAAAARSVARFGQDAVPYVSDLITALSDEYLDVRVAAAAGLGHLGRHAAAAQPALEKLRDAENFLFRETVREALLAITALPAR